MAPSSRPSGPQRSSSRVKTELGRTNSLNMSRIELDAVLDALDGDPAAGTNPKRHSARMAFREIAVTLEVSQPGGQTRISVASRNLSRTGLGFLHSSYLHVGTEVVATLPHRTLGKVAVHGSIVRCRHVKRNIHDVGVQFAKPLNLRDFLAIDTLTQVFSCEKVDPEQLKGVVLVVAEYKIEQGCIQSMLAGTAVEFLAAANIAEGLETACKGCDVVICDDVFSDGTGAEFITQARQRGVRCPIIIMSADRSAEARARLRAANASGFLEKPVAADVLLRAMAEFLIVSGHGAQEASPLSSTLPSDSPLGTLADEFVSDLHTCADDVERLAAANDVDALRKRVLRIAGAAPALGFDPIAKLCNVLLAEIDARKVVADAVVTINTFVATCRSVRPRPAAQPAAPAPVEGHETEHAMDASAKPAAAPAHAPHAAAPKAKAA